MNYQDYIEDAAADEIRAAYVAGLRRAKELAEDYCEGTLDGGMRIFDQEAFNQAIDAAAKKA